MLTKIYPNYFLKKKEKKKIIYIFSIRINKKQT